MTEATPTSDGGNAGTQARSFPPAKKTRSQLGRWWKWRGGWRDFFRSPYTRLALVLMLPSIHFWTTESWWELPLQILPNVIGFSLGGYAILLAFGDDGFRRLLVKGVEKTEPADAPSLYMEVSAIFLHFIIVQLLSLLLAVVARVLYFDIGEALGIAALNSYSVERVIEWGSYVLGFLGFFLFLYALALAAAAAMSVFGLSEGFEFYLKDQAKKQDNPK